MNVLKNGKTIVGAVLLLASTITRWVTGEEAVSIEGILNVVDVVGVTVTGTGLAHKCHKAARIVGVK